MLQQVLQPLHAPYPLALLSRPSSLCVPGVVNAGNFFFAGARTFFNSLEAAIFLFSRVARIPEGSSVMPVISTEERITLGAVLSNGLVIKGQNQISHPSVAGPFQLALHLLYQKRYHLRCQYMIRLSNSIPQKCFCLLVSKSALLVQTCCRTQPDCIVHTNIHDPISFVRLLALPGSPLSQGLSAIITLCL